MIGVNNELILVCFFSFACIGTSWWGWDRPCACARAHGRKKQKCTNQVRSTEDRWSWNSKVFGSVVELVLRRVIVSCCGAMINNRSLVSDVKFENTFLLTSTVSQLLPRRRTLDSFTYVMWVVAFTYAVFGIMNCVATRRTVVLRTQAPLPLPCPLLGTTQSLAAEF